MKEIDYMLIIANYDSMINVLEYDSMRSAGKAKLNCQHLESMYSLKGRYTKLLADMTKPAPVKKEG